MAHQAQRATPTTVEGQGATQLMDRGALVGVWRFTLAPIQGTPAPALVTVHADGTLIVALVPVEAFLGDTDRVVFLSAGHGLWEFVAVNTVGVEIMGLAATGQGAPAASATIWGRLGLSADSRSLSGSYEAAVYDPAGARVATEQGAMHATRITLGSQGVPAWSH